MRTSSLGSWLRRAVRRLRKAPRREKRRARLQLEALEDRMVPSTLLWANRGSLTNDSDDFNKTFGTNAYKARQVVDAALQEWGSVIARGRRGIGGSGRSRGMYRPA